MNQLYQNNVKNAFLIGILLVGLTFKAQAGEDPLGKPAVWSKIKSSPIDSVLWAQYFGKAWVCLDDSELAIVKEWQTALMEDFEVDAAASVSDINWDNPKLYENGRLEFVDHEVEAEKQRLEKEKNEYIRDLESSMMQDPPEIAEMKKNIPENFIIIEEWYEEQFLTYSVDYVWYEDKYPKKGYSKVDWIHDKEKELAELRKKDFEKRKAALLSKN